MELLNGTSVLYTSFASKKYKYKGSEKTWPEGSLVCASLDYIHPKSQLGEDSPLDHIKKTIFQDLKFVRLLLPSSDLSKIKHKVDTQVFKQSQFPFISIFVNTKQIVGISSGYSGKPQSLDLPYMNSERGIDNIRVPSALMQSFELKQVYGVYPDVLVKLNSDAEIKKYENQCRKQEKVYDSNHITNNLQPLLKKAFSELLTKLDRKPKLSKGKSLNSIEAVIGNKTTSKERSKGKSSNSIEAVIGKKTTSKERSILV